MKKTKLEQEKWPYGGLVRFAQRLARALKSLAMASVAGLCNQKRGFSPKEAEERP